MDDTHKANTEAGITVPPWVEIISAGGHPLTYIIRGGQLPDRTTFLTPPEFKQQVGYVAYPAGGEIARHAHRPLERHMIGTSEVLFVLKGRARIDVYDDSHALVASRELAQGDVMLMVGGGHGFRIIEDTVFMEIKQGPYAGVDEKERF
jgi:mannose-6-phosphate isomerase-like protein (cupin superfamily)